MTLNDLECPIHLKVRLVGGTLDVRLLRVSDSTICIDVATGGKGGWAGGPSPPPCGQLTRCFSAVAELLVSGGRRKTYLFLFGAYRNCVSAVQGHPRSMNLVLIESAYATSY